jgi:hypothetical protein
VRQGGFDEQRGTGRNRGRGDWAGDHALPGPGKSVLLADLNEDTLEAIGHSVTTQRVDVASRESVSSLAKAAAGLGSVAQVAHTAGLSPVQAPPAAILAVDLLGTALVGVPVRTLPEPQTRNGTRVRRSCVRGRAARRFAPLCTVILVRHMIAPIKRMAMNKPAGFSPGTRGNQANRAVMLLVLPTWTPLGSIRRLVCQISTPWAMAAATRAATAWRRVLASGWKPGLS